MSTRLEATQHLINVKKQLEQLHHQEYTIKEFLDKYAVRLNLICSKPTRQVSFKLSLELNQDWEVSLSSLYKGSYKIVINNQTIEVNLSNIKDYVNCERQWGRDRLTWKQDFQSYIQVKKYYYSYEDIIKGLDKKINDNIVKENEQVLKMRNHRDLILNDIDNRINERVNILNDLQQQL